MITENKERQPLEWMETLLYSWGGDTPQEVYWGLNEMIVWLNTEHDFQLKEIVHPFIINECDNDYDEDERLLAVSDALNSLHKTT